MTNNRPSRRALLGSAATAVGTLSGCVDLAQENTNEADNPSTNSTDPLATKSTEQTQEENGAANETEPTESNEDTPEEKSTDNKVADETREIIKRVAESTLAAFSSGEFDRMKSFIYPDSPTEAAVEGFDETFLEGMSENLDIELQSVTVQERTENQIIAQVEVRYVEPDEKDRIRSGEAELRFHDSEWLIYSGDFLLPV